MAEYEGVKIERALVEPDGFYAHLNRIPIEHRKVVLVRLPKDTKLESLDGMKLNLGGKRKQATLGTLEIKGKTGVTNYEMQRTLDEPIPMSLAVPGSKGMQAEGSIIDEMWALTRASLISAAADMPASVESQPLDFDGDVGGKGKPRAQPEGLAMNLSAMDVTTIVNRKRGKKAPVSSSKASSTPSPSKKSKKSK